MENNAELTCSGEPFGEKEKKKADYALDALDYFAGRDSKGLGALLGLVGEESNADFEALIEGYQERLKSDAKEQRVRIEQALSSVEQA